VFGLGTQLRPYRWDGHKTVKNDIRNSALAACVRLGTAAALAAVLAGCGVSTLTSGLGGGIFGGSGTPTTSTKGVSEEQLLTAAKAEANDGFGSGGEAVGGCPRFVVWPRDNNLTIYEQGRVGDGLAVKHRGEITKTARECQIEQNKVTVKYGFSGRVLLGPKGQAGPISMPLNVFVTDAKREKVTNDKVKVDVTVAVDKPIGYFSVVRTVTFTVPEGARAGEFELFVGFERNVPGAG
jgi:hypothetical protein